MKKIGFIGSTFRRHSVSHIAQWLWKEIDPERFELVFYSIADATDEISEWLAQRHKFWKCATVPVFSIASYLEEDDIDLLIDLDGATNYKTLCCSLVNLPCPTLSWLGFTPHGGYDYILADAVTLPQHLEYLYAPAKVVRLPGPYLATGGFSVIPSRQDRRTLNIPEDAFVFLTVQKPMKQAQMMPIYKAIMDECPNAYLVVRDFAGTGYRQWYTDSLGSDRLRFLDIEPIEDAARSNYTLANVVLDTYPYNGTTTTLEAMWAGVPVVSQTGRQFSARQAATLGCYSAYSIEIEAVSLCQDPDSYAKAIASCYLDRHTNPVWDYRQFAQNWQQAIEDIIDGKYSENSTAVPSLAAK